MRSLLLLLLAVLYLASAEDYCGPGALTFPTSPDINACCKQHDADYDSLAWYERLMPWKRAKFELKFCKCLDKVGSAHAYFKCAIIMVILPFG